MLSVKNVSFSYGDKKILEDINLDLKEGETIALIGTSGSGKTTLLKIISGLLEPKTGSITTPDSGSSYMSQQDLLLPWRSIENNVKLACELEKIEFTDQRLNQLLEYLEIDSYKSRFPHELSGGQYKRAMLARALAPEKELLLLDEPFSSLDLPLRDKLYSRLKNLNKSSLLLVTHDFRDAFYLADRILVLNQGKIGKEWVLDKEKKEDPTYLGILFQELKVSLVH